MQEEGKEEELACFQQLDLASFLDIQTVILFISNAIFPRVRQAHLLALLG